MTAWNQNGGQRRTVYKKIFIVLIFKQKQFNNDLWVWNNLRRNIESGNISRFCLVFLIETVVLRTSWCNLKEASIATKQNSKITQRISYSVLNIKMSKICFNYWNGRINRILGLVLNIAQVYPAWPKNVKSHIKPRDFRFSHLTSNLVFSIYLSIERITIYFILNSTDFINGSSLSKTCYVCQHLIEMPDK